VACFHYLGVRLDVSVDFSALDLGAILLIVVYMAAATRDHLPKLLLELQNHVLLAMDVPKLATALRIARYKLLKIPFFRATLPVHFFAFSGV